MDAPVLTRFDVAAELPRGENNPRNSEGDFALLKDGSVLFAYSRYTGSDAHDDAACDVAGLLSYDGGRSFVPLQEPLATAAELHTQNIMSVSLCRLPDGTLCLFYLAKFGPRSAVYLKRAKEGGGLSFGPPELCVPQKRNIYYVVNNARVTLSPQGEVLQSGGIGPSSEIKMHLRCYRERPDVGGVVHAHPPTATGYAVANKPLDDYSMIETVIAIGSVPVTPYGTPSTDEVPEAITPYLQEHDVMLLQNHGALTVGADVLTAYYRMETLELFAKISLTAHLLGGAQELSRANIDRLIDMRSQYKVTGKHPGYKKYSGES